MSDKKSQIALQHDLYMEEIRNPQLAECAEKIEIICREYGIYDTEFDALTESVKDSLFSFKSFLNDDSDEDESDDNAPI